MKRSFIVGIAIILLGILGIVGCSKDKPTGNGLNPISGASALVGTWLRTTTLADGDTITEGNDTLGVWDDDQIIFRADSTGLHSSSDGTWEILNWYTDGSDIVATAVEGGIQGTYRIQYAQQGNSLSLFYPAGPEDEQYNIPDLEYIYTRQ